MYCEYRTIEERAEDILQPTQVEEQAPTTTIDQKMVFILSVACTMSVANLYYSQPLLASSCSISAHKGRKS